MSELFIFFLQHAEKESVSESVSDFSHADWVQHGHQELEYLKQMNEPTGLSDLFIFCYYLKAALVSWLSDREFVHLSSNPEKGKKNFSRSLA